MRQLIVVAMRHQMCLRQSRLPIIQGVLSYPDQRLVESAALCIICLIESYHCQLDLLDELLTLNDKLTVASRRATTPGPPLVAAVASLLRDVGTLERNPLGMRSRVYARPLQA
jgi:hypothetical protein